jgi:hypothetical protein
MKGCWILSKAFSSTTDVFMWFLSLILFMCCIMFIDLHWLNHPCLPGMKPAWPWCMIYLMYWWIWFASILLRVFLLWGLNSGPTPWATPPDTFCEEFHWGRVLWTLCQIWFHTSVLLMYASWVARIIGVSHRHPDDKSFCIYVNQGNWSFIFTFCYILIVFWIQGNAVLYAVYFGNVICASLRMDISLFYSFIYIFICFLFSWWLLSEETPLGVTVPTITQGTESRQDKQQLKKHQIFNAV